MTRLFHAKYARVNILARLRVTNTPAATRSAVSCPPAADADAAATRARHPREGVSDAGAKDAREPSVRERF
jgi:hypothetical protein